MEIIKKIKLMQELSEKWRRDGHIISCVPTMVFLHQGHIELLRVGRAKGNRLIMTIFVNPTHLQRLII